MMNRQAITFLSLFSLILVLSVFYILIPPIDETEISVVSEVTSEVVSLQETLDASRQDLVTSNNEVIASANSSSQDIEDALESIAQTKELIAKEDEIVTLLVEAGYVNAYVEINDSSISVVVEKETATSSDANTIIQLIMNEYGQNYQVEVKFV
ncbi:SpoIIIAH-like family protein [Tannockella kyphosi]|uniref:SpoIIIAH-like family protein n=1 Tax=Tannockella kyphosi TaxID=2899121 RepID=UPI0020137EDA|nr:SpoIIIAH-like family protein [Tannockella kyphosi]